MDIGILGYGRFGSLIDMILKERLGIDAKIYSPDQQIDNKRFFDMDKVLKSEIIIICVPISSFEEVIKLISNKVNPNSMIVDVCSVKVHPVKVMKKYLPDKIDILATHPMFGPDSTKNGTTFDGLKFIYYPVRIKNIDRANLLLTLLEKLGLEIIELTPEDHDKQAAYTHAYAFLVGKIGMMMEIRKNNISTKGFENLIYNQTAVENDTGQLFHDMMTYNPYSNEMRANFRKTLNEIEGSLN